MLNTRLKSLLDPFLAGACVLSAAGMLVLSRYTRVHWDEFYYLSKVHAVARGEWSVPLQSGYAHFFEWLQWVSPNEVDQVLAARCVVWLVALGGGLALFKATCWLTGSRTGGFVGVLAAWTCPLAVHHGTSFRADPLMAALFCGALACLVAPRARAGLAGLFGAALVFVSVKAALLLPALGLVALLPLRAGDRRWTGVRRAAIFAAITGLFATTSLALHDWTLADAEPGRSAALMKKAGGAMFGWLPRQDVLLNSLVADWSFWGAVVCGALLATFGVLRKSGVGRWRAMAALACALPLLSVLGYRNAWPYYYACVMPPAAVLAGWLGATLRRRLGPSAVPMLVVPLVWQGATTVAWNRVDTLSHQREFLSAVHTLFPEPVPYLDRSGMVSSFPKAGPFLTTFTLGAYRAAGVPVMKAVLADSKPVFLVANTSGLQLDEPWDKRRGEKHRRLEEDFSVLKSHFARHEGPLWLAGALLEAGAPSTVSLHVSGPYTLLGDFSVRVDDQRVQPGEAIELEAGEHAITPEGVGGEAWLRYGRNLAQPLGLSPTQALLPSLPHPRGWPD